MTQFKSKFEEQVAELYGYKELYELTKLTYTLANTYTPDFTISDNVFLECKGFFKPSDRRKMLEVMKQHPDKKFIMLFQNSTVKITKKSNTSYGDWCNKQGITWFCWKTKKPTKRILTLAASSSSD
jgi:predicted nuclease of restriction endonuclease-like RecB superfamily